MSEACGRLAFAHFLKLAMISFAHFLLFQMRMISFAHFLLFQLYIIFEPQSGAISD